MHHDADDRHVEHGRKLGNGIWECKTAGRVAGRETKEVTSGLKDLAGASRRGVVGGDELEDRPKLKLKKGSSVKEDIAEVVREDPDAAAAILRSWIGNAG